MRLDNHLATFPVDNMMNQLNQSAERAAQSMIIDSSVASERLDNAEEEQRSYKSSAFLQEKNSTIISKKSIVAHSEQRAHKSAGMTNDVVDYHQGEQHSEELQSSIQNYRNLR